MIDIYCVEAVYLDTKFNALKSNIIRIGPRCSDHGRRHVGGRVGNRPPWKKSGWAMPTLKIPAVVWKLSGNCLSMKV